MKKVLIIILAMLMSVTAAADEIAVDEPIVEFVCADFTLTLPDGMILLGEDVREGFAAVVMADLSLDEDLSVMTACDADLQRGVCVCAVYREDDVNAIASEIAAAAAEYGMTVSEVVNLPTERYSGAMFTVTMEESQYMQAVLTDGSTCLVIAAVGMESRELQTMLETVEILTQE